MLEQKEQSLEREDLVGQVAGVVKTVHQKVCQHQRVLQARNDRFRYTNQSALHQRGLLA
jgi:hypothetical protein